MMSFGAAQEASREMEVQSVSSEVTLCRTYDRVGFSVPLTAALCVFFGDAGARTQCGDSRDGSVSISS